MNFFNLCTKHLRALRICVKSLPAFQIKLEYGLISQEKLHTRQQTAGEGFDEPGNLYTCCSKYHVTL